MFEAQMFCWIRLFVAVPLTLVALVGCGGSKHYQVGEVEGTVLINGKPANKIFVQFIPEVAGEASPPLSNGQTDESGHFVLNLVERGGSMQPGAAVGTHRVVLRDLQAAESPGANGGRPRLLAKYTMPSSTPLTEEVKAGKQTIEIQVPPK